MRALHTLAFALCLPVLLAGCGGGDGKADAGVDAGAPPEEYFGLQKGRCFEYTTADVAQAAPDLGVVVEEMDTKQFPVPTYKTAYIIGGVAMYDYLAIDGEAMVLYKREFPGGKSYIYDPPLKRLVKPVYPNTKQEDSTQVTIRDGTGAVLAKETHKLRVDVFGAADVQLPIGKTVSATKLAFQETLEDGTAAGRSEFRTFLPGTGDRVGADGFVKIDFNFSLNESNANVIYKLQKVRDLGDSPTTATPPCGSAP